MTHLALQERLQREAYGLHLLNMTDEERIEQIKINVLALTDELHEALAEVGWKPWATSRHINQESLQGELIDAYHFLMNLMVVAGLSDKDVDYLYLKKNRRNLERQREGYDGVGGKCPVCHRALDDVRSSVENMADQSRAIERLEILTTGFCSQTCFDWDEAYG